MRRHGRSTRTGAFFGSSRRHTRRLRLDALDDGRPSGVRRGALARAECVNPIERNLGASLVLRVGRGRRSDRGRSVAEDGRRPPKRKPDIYRPSSTSSPGFALQLSPTSGRRFFSWREQACAGPKSSAVGGPTSTWLGRTRVHRKGQHWHWLPLDPDVVDELRASFRQLQPELDDHVFTVEVEQWVSAYEREA